MAEKYDLKPSKEAYRAVKSDVTPVSAFKELIDNALDNWMRVSQRLDDIIIEVEYYEGDVDETGKVVVRDDTGGVDEDDVHILFALGQSKKDQVTGSIGAYGIGAKKAIVNLGNRAVIRSRALHSKTGYGFSIDENWLRDDDDWSVEKEVHEDIEDGVTEIQIEDLNIDWGDYKENLKEDLSETYQRFLAGTYDEDRGDLTIVIKEYDSEDWSDPAERTVITPPDPVEWSFAPIDGFHPRRYEGIELESRELDDTVFLNVTVGLMRGSDSDISGADIFCQDRKVLTAVRDDRAAFGTGSGSNRVGNFSNQHHRLKMIIEFETDGDASQLPWDAQKSDIDPYNRVAQAAYSWVRRIIKPYHKAAGAYEDLPTAFLEPYDRDSEFAVTADLDEPYDYTGRERVMDKPDTDMPEAKRIGTRAVVSQILKVYAPGDLDEKFIPAFESDLDRLFNKGADEKTDIDALPRVEGLPALDEDEAEDIVEQLTQEARGHLRKERRAAELPGWQQVVYDQILEQLLAEDDRELSFDDLEPLEEDETSAISTGGEDEEEGPVEPDTTGEESEPSMTGSPLFDTNDENAASEAAEEVAEEVAQEVSEDIGGDDETTERVQKTLEDRMKKFSESLAGDGNIRTLRLPREDWAELTDALGLDEDASEEEVRAELLSTMQLLRQLRSPA